MTQQSSKRLASRFLLLVSLLLLSCMTRADPVFTEDFEAGWGAWSTDNGVWGVGSPTAGPAACYSGSSCAGTVLNGNYPEESDSRLITPALELPSLAAFEELLLRFQQWFSYYNSSDVGYVQISRWDNDSASWGEFQTVALDVTDQSGGWSPAQVDLTPFAGERVRIAFFHTARNSVNPSNDASYGWYLDDLELIAKVPLFSGDFEDGPGDWSADRGVWQPATGRDPGWCAVGTGCIGTVLSGSYPEETDSRLISPTVELPSLAAGEELQLRFQQWFSYYNASDVGYVQVAQWDSDSASWGAFQTLAFSVTDQSAVWSPSQVDLTPFAGERVRIAFLHTARNSVNPANDASSGWFIDDLQLIAKVPLFSGDFEDGPGDWWADRGVWESATDQEPERCAVGTGCIGTVLTGDYPEETDSRLISPTVELPSLAAGEELQLRFQQQFDYYNSSDVGYVQVAQWDNDSASWGEFQTVALGVTDQSGGWSPAQVDLTPFAGERVRIAFWHTARNSVNPASDASSGWLIDDLELIAKVPLFSGDFEDGPGDWWADRGVWQPATGRDPGWCAVGTGCIGTVLTGNYPEETDSRLISPTVELPSLAAGEELQLRFQQWFSYYNASDVGYVQVAQWDSDSASWGAFQTLAFSVTDQSAVWSPAQVDLTSFAGERVRIAFLHTARNSVNPSNDASSGWYLDDLQLIAKLPLFSGDFEDGLGDWWADRGVWQPATGRDPGWCAVGAGCIGTVLADNYPEETDSRLISPTFELPNRGGGEAIFLRFQQWFSYYNSSDAGYVQIGVWDEQSSQWQAFQT